MSQRYTDIMISQVWSKLEAEISEKTDHHLRKYRRLDLEKETGVRLGCVSPGFIWEMLIEAASPGEDFEMDLPEWKGMGFEIINLDVPVNNTPHIRLFLDQKEYKDIFVAICADLIRALDEYLTNKGRRGELSEFLKRWNRFFMRHGHDGLPSEYQQGLFGELFWLRHMLEANLELPTVLNAWKGCERGYHDFEINGHIVEVKTTMTKEPRKVMISNERQLDEHGLKSLHLYVVTLIKTEAGGQTLPELVQEIREYLSDKSVSHKFEQLLREAGYLDIHAPMYKASYTVKKEELFRISDGFPRITELPSGVGDLRYSVILAAGASFLCGIPKYLGFIKEQVHANG